MDTSPSPPPPAPPPQLPLPAAVAAMPAPSMVARSTRSHYNPEENTITNICTSNIIMDLPQVTTRSRTGAIKPQPATPAVVAASASPSSTTSNPPTVTKIIIKQIPLPADAASSTRQPPPLQQMHSTPPPPRLQQMVHAQAPPPLHAKPRGTASTPPPLQIKVVPSARQNDSASQMMKPGGETAAMAPSSGLTVDMGQSAEATGTEEAAEEGVGTDRGVSTLVTSSESHAVTSFVSIPLRISPNLTVSLTSPGDGSSSIEKKKKIQI